MIAHIELYAIYAGCAGVVWFLGWWTRGPRSRSLDKTWRDGYEQGCDDEIASCEPQSSFKNGPEPDEERPAGPSPAAGRTDDDDAWLSNPDLVRPGRTYSELVMLAAQDTPGPLDDALTAPVDPGWFPEALRRSEAWLAECRAELGL